MGRYFKFWVNDENEESLAQVDNWSGTINSALKLYFEKLETEPTEKRAQKKIAREPQAASKECPNGHLLVDEKHCMVKGCKYAK